MDQFYQTLRKIQKKERNNATLAQVDESFYRDIHEYLDKLKNEAINDPFSNSYAILKEAQRIATEICERREHKITDAAVVNIQRSYHLFIGKPQFDLIDTTPLNLTPEEETFYFSLIDTLKNHRGKISLEKLSDGEDVETSSKPVKSIKKVDTESKKDVSEKPQDNNVIKEPKKPLPSNKPKPQKTEPADDISELINEDDQFVDFNSKRVASESEVVPMLVFDNIGSIVGVDENVYGPFFPQDIVMMPKINAKIFVKARKARFINI